ncbi:hypothetical protein PGT21_015965 [Puccinia graminis f. sp. tritici]|uniref:LIM zinc-binding domain-containing protein n=1 Tax=Puccinia graminis f. sp. tritici TaxID=56615 RepID=A0A5B0LTE3_PUCGR|nr:hypothetical protein PGT21_015965 [Puccinia graminis f. sp. tritici]KAA1093514.1 hypothetical protein PGTUg99_024194 [Puccinia graminis f. sp. tritici]
MSTPLLRRLAQYQQQQQHQQQQEQEPNNNAGLTRRTQSIKRPLPPVPPTTTTHTNSQQPQQQPPLTAISINKLNSQENRTADQGPSRTKPLPQPPAPSRPIIPPVHGRPTELSNPNYHPYHQQPHTHNQFIPHHHHHHHHQQQHQHQQQQQTASFHQLPPFHPPSNFHPQPHPQPSSSDHHRSFSHHADHHVVDEQTIHATDERGDQHDVQQVLVVDSEPRDDSGHEASNEEEKPGVPELVVPRMVFNDDDDDHDDDGVSRAEESEEDSLPGIMVTEEEGVPGIVVSVESPPAPKGTTRKKPFIADEGRRTSGPRGATVGGPRTITPVRKAERVVSTEARSRQRSVPQMIVSSTDEDSSNQHPQEHPHHHQQSRDDCPPRQLAAPMGPHSLACAGCRQLIAGRIVHALDAKWHPDCFVCQHCSLVLEHVAFYEHEGKAYCGVDYDELFSLKCYHCNTSINEDSYVSLDDPSLKDGPRHYHKLHLFCSECGDPFIDPKSLEEQSRISALPNHNQDRMPTVNEPKPFVLFNGYPYCEKCDVRLHRPKCFTCKAPITDDFINALNKLFHSDCFVCFECHNPFSNNQFFLVPYADLDPSVDPKSKRGAQQVPICLNCYS